jgi:radical SAM protein with 4Fe4S-binding SPASM domain
MVQKKETRQFRWTDDLCAVVDRQIDGIIGDMAAQHGLGEAPVARLLADEGLLSQMLGLHYIPRYLREPRRYYPACPCGEKFAMVDPTGNVYFCPVHKDRIAGNLKESSFDDIWLSEKAQDARRFFNERKCHCWLTCTNTHMIASAMRDGKQAFMRRLFDKTQAKE